MRRMTYHSCGVLVPYPQHVPDCPSSFVTNDTAFGWTSRVSTTATAAFGMIDECAIDLERSLDTCNEVGRDEDRSLGLDDGPL